ncbi:acetamidase/formamidase family protein [Acuticoccus sp.]|uniref:acetamidase/formamidase family protein n=1 Tax=Acuticoccus sp. TaxID=1904378 RepID=UPI003B515906
MSTHHTLDASPQTVHWGHFDATLEPCLAVRSGDRVTMTTVSGNLSQTPGRERLLPAHAAVLDAVKPEVGPHIMTGPVAVEGAEPGDLLEVRIEDITLPCDWGFNVVMPLRGTLPEDFPEGQLIIVELDRAAGLGTLPFGMTVPLAPFFGVMGVAPPPGWGRVGSIEPRDFGGNMDLKELVAGTTLYLPVFVPGALFSVGDGHGAQGDGEVCLSAIETCLTGTFTLILHKAAGVRFPRAETPTHWITMGFNEDLDDAAKQALREMIALLGELKGLAPMDAYVLCSLAADLRVTQLVDGNKGIHAMLPKALL